MSEYSNPFCTSNIHNLPKLLNAATRLQIKTLFVSLCQRPINKNVLLSITCCFVSFFSIKCLRERERDLKNIFHLTQKLYIMWKFAMHPSVRRLSAAAQATQAGKRQRQRHVSVSITSSSRHCSQKRTRHKNFKILSKWKDTENL